MKCVTYNIQFGTGRDGHVDLDRIVGEIHGADIIALQEVERFWPRSGNVDQVAVFRKHFPDHYAVYGSGVDIHLPGSTPTDNKRRQFGNMVLSRYPIEFSRVHLLPKVGSINGLSIQRCAVEATLRIGSELLRVYSVHLTHLSSATRLPQVDRLLEIHDNMVREGYPVDGDLEGKDFPIGVEHQEVARQAVMFGDFNFQPDGPEYPCMVGPVGDYDDHVHSRDRFVDAWVHCGNDLMSGATSDVHDVPARLDYCFVGTEIRNCIENCTVDTSAEGSDHLPIWLDLNL